MSMLSRCFMSCTFCCFAFLGLPISGARLDTHKQTTGVLVMAHGGSPAWNEAVEEAVATLRKECPVVIAFGMADRESLQEGVVELESQGVNRIAVVRLFISGESFLHQTEYLLNLRNDPPSEFIQHQPHGGGHRHQQEAQESSAPAPIKTQAQIIINRSGLADFDGVSKILGQRVEALSVAPARESVLILAHGMGDEQENSRLLVRMSALIRPLKETGEFRALQIEALREDWPDKRKLAEERIREFVTRAKQNDRRAIVVPFRLFGFGDYDKVLDGLDYVADRKGLLPHPLIADWIRMQAEECFRQAGGESPFSSN